jgi:hypothetical protein
MQAFQNLFRNIGAFPDIRAELSKGNKATVPGLMKVRQSCNSSYHSDYKFAYCHVRYILDTHAACVDDCLGHPIVYFPGHFAHVSPSTWPTCGDHRWQQNAHLNSALMPSVSALILPTNLTPVCRNLCYCIVTTFL